MNEQEAIELLQNLNVKLTEMAGNKVNGIDEIFGWNEITAICEAIKALEEIQQYHKIGLTPNMVKEMIKSEQESTHYALIHDAMLKQYEAIGTVEECRAAVEKQKAKKPTPIDYKKYMDVVKNAKFLKGAFWCPNCNHAIRNGDYCDDCGQKLDWSDEE